METAFKPQRAIKQQLSEKKGYVNQLLVEGSKKANALAEQTLKNVRQAIGFETAK